MKLLFVVALFLVQGCTTVGLVRLRPLPDEFAQPVALRLCTVRDPNVSERRVRTLVSAWNGGVGRTVGVWFEVTRIDIAKRQALTLADGDVRLIRQARYAATLPVGDGCDRWAYFAGSSNSDLLSAALSAVGAPIRFGIHDDVRGSAVAITATLVHPFQLWPWYQPSAVVQHEFMHLFGCSDRWAFFSPFFTWWSLDECYERIAGWKRLRVARCRAEAARVAALEEDIATSAAICLVPTAGR